MKEQTKSISIQDIASMSGVSIDEVKEIAKKNPSLKFMYEELTLSEQNRVISEIHEELQQTGLPVSGKNDSSRWETGWGEILESINDNGFNPSLLKPQYFKHKVLRFNRNFIKSSCDNFEYDLFTILRKIVFKKYLTPYSKIIELGCGTGSNLYVMRKLFPEVTLMGFDWVQSSLKILEVISQNVPKEIESGHFNMLTLEGKENIPIDQETAVITIHAMEQLANSFLPVLNYILAKKPGIVVHLEPILELYDPKNILDDLAIKWHKKRNYLNGYLPVLEELEKKKSIEILEKHRFYFGSIFHEAYSLIVWQPKL